MTGTWLTMRPPGYHPILRALSLPWSFLSIDGVWGSIRSRGDWINAGVFALLAVAAVRKLSWSVFSTPRSLLWLWLLSPCLGMVAVDLARGTYVTAVPRYAFAGMPAAFLLVGLGLDSLGPRLRALFVGLIVLFYLAAVGRFYAGDARNGQDYPGVAKLLSHEVGRVRPDPRALHPFLRHRHRALSGARPRFRDRGRLCLVGWPAGPAAGSGRHEGPRDRPQRDRSDRDPWVREPAPESWLEAECDAVGDETNSRSHHLLLQAARFDNILCASKR